MLSPDDLKSRARRLVEEVLNQGDLAVAHELMATDVVHHVPGPPPANGIESFREFLANLRRAFPDHHAVIEDQIAEGDLVVQRITNRGTHTGPFLDISPTGRHVTYEAIDITRVGPDGKFVEHWSSVDLFGLLIQLGVLEQPALRQRSGSRTTDPTIQGAPS